jgi:DNA invertase Pin-like site-specific DNA recombinase
MRERHERERKEQVERLAQSRITQTEAAKYLGISLQCLNNFVQRHKIFWPVKKQGRR